MAYDTARGRLVLFGGSGQSGSQLGDTWEFDGTSWTQLFPANSPSPRYGGAMAFDPVLGRTVLFGGWGNNGRLGDTWEWDGANWTQASPSSAPYPRFFHSMVFNAQLGKTILFGGDFVRPYALGPTNDTWEWDGVQWTQDWTNAAPSPRAGQSLVYDLGRSRAVLFGGTDETFSHVFYNDTWELGAGIVTLPSNPTATFTPSSLGFGYSSVGVTTSSFAVWLVSSGTGPLVIGSLSTTGDFSIPNTDCPVSPNPLAAGSSCIVLVNFTPTAAGDRQGALVVSDNSPGGAQSVPLTGTGTANATTLTVNPATAPFGGTAYVTATLTSNSGPVYAASVSLALPNGASATVQTDLHGVATWPAASVAGLNPGSYPGGIQASFAGNQGYLGSSAAATLTVSDTDLALASVPGDITAIATGSSGVIVTYSSPAVVDETGDISAPAASCAPASGSTFAVGTTTVTCSATSGDDSPATVSATFSVTVLVDLNVTVTVAPSAATTGTLVTGSVSVTNTGSVAKTVTLFAAFRFGDITFTSTKAIVKLNPGQTATRTLTYRVSKSAPRGAYSFSATATDVTGIISSAATFSVG
jgi:HYR domain/CARDB/Galactose oxidase, central domain